MTQGKVKSLHENIKQKNLNLKNFNSSKGWFDIFRKRFGFKKCKDNRSSSFCQLKGDRQVQMPTEETERLSASTGSQCREECPILGKKCHKGYLLVMKKRCTRP